MKTTDRNQYIEITTDTTDIEIYGNRIHIPHDAISTWKRAWSNLSVSVSAVIRGVQRVILG